MQVNPEIFKAYDVRGLYPGELHEEIVRLIGRGFAAYLQTDRIAVSRDMRVSSPALSAAFIEGVREQGTDVVDYGMLGTDMLYFAVVRDELGGGAQITASHNPKQYNGMKMVRREAFPLSGEAGIGKSRLVSEMKSRAENRGLLVLRGQCFETDRALPYAPFVDLLPEPFQQQGDGLLGCEDVGDVAEVHARDQFLGLHVGQRSHCTLANGTRLVTNQAINQRGHDLWKLRRRQLAKFFDGSDPMVFPALGLQDP